jgi:hypothetical protein
MKKIVLAFFCLYFFHTISAQEVSNDQWAMFSKKTAEWCPKCGTWGWTMMEGVLEALENENVIIWGLHYNGDLMNQVSLDITQNFGGFSQPIFYINNLDINALSFNVQEKVNETIATIDSLKNVNAVAGVKIDAVFDGDNNLMVNGKVKFFEDSNSEYYLGFYEIEDHFLYSQAGYGPDADHRKLLRKQLVGESFGGLITTTALAGEEFPISMSLPNYIISDPVNTEIAVVLWKKINGIYIFENGYLDRSLDTNASVLEEEYSPSQLQGYYSAFDNNIVLNIENVAFEKELTFVLTNLNGEILLQKTLNEIQSLNNKVRIGLPSLSSGVYIAYVRNLSKHYATKILIAR